MGFDHVSIGHASKKRAKSNLDVFVSTYLIKNEKPGGPKVGDKRMIVWRSQKKAKSSGGRPG
jgi:hypothetical protein